MCYLYLTERWDAAWNPREMGSTRVGVMREGPASQAESEISSQPPAEEGTTASWSEKKTGRRVRRDREDPSCTE
jgi:hypothetical protein